MSPHNVSSPLLLLSELLSYAHGQGVARSINNVVVISNIMPLRGLGTNIKLHSVKWGISLSNRMCKGGKNKNPPIE